jgi:hypothetical protein
LAESAANELSLDSEIVTSDEITVLVQRLSVASGATLSGQSRVADVAEALSVDPSQVRSMLDELRRPKSQPLVAPAERTARKALLFVAPAVLLVSFAAFLLVKTETRTPVAAPEPIASVGETFAPAIDEIPPASATEGGRNLDWSVPENITFKLGEIYLTKRPPTAWNSHVGDAEKFERLLTNGLMAMVQEWSKPTEHGGLTLSVNEVREKLKGEKNIPGAFVFRSLRAMPYKGMGGQLVNIPIPVNSTVEEYVLEEQRRRIRRFANQLVFEWKLVPKDAPAGMR